MQETTLDLDTADGPMTTFIVHPEREGPHPLVVFQMDAAGIREELRHMARRLATSGYYVMLPNLYHRSRVLELPADAGMDRMGALMDEIDAATVAADCAVAIAHAQSDSAAQCERIGTVGYCMSGQYAIRLAAARPDMVRAAASFHGVHLMTDEPDSPHRLMREAAAEIYIGIAELDAYAPVTEAEPLREAMARDGVRGEVEVYPGLDHGFVFPERKAGIGSPKPPYDVQGDLRHWERLIALLRRNIG